MASLKMLDIGLLIEEIRHQRSHKCFAASGALIGYLDALGYVVLDQADEIVVYNPLIEVEAISPVPKTEAPKEPTLDDLLIERSEARTRKDWARADAIRKLFENRGLAIADQKDGTCRLVPLPKR